MQKAFISGRLGQAVYRKGKTLWVLSKGSGDREASDRDVSRLMHPSAEYDLCECSSETDASLLLEEATKEQDALFLVLSCINPDLSINTRITCAQAVDPLLRVELQKKLVRRLYSNPLPSAVRIQATTSLQYFTSFEQLASLLRGLFESQEAIATVVGAFDAATLSLPAQDVIDIRYELVNRDVFATLARLFRSENVHDFNNFIVTTLLGLKQDFALSVVAVVLTEMQRNLSRLSRFGVSRQRELKLDTLEGTQSSLRRNRPNIEGLLVADPLFSLSHFSGLEAKTDVDKQIAGIKTQILAARPDLVEKYLLELVRFQMKHSEKHQLAKSLSLLTSVALASNQLRVADQISLYALQLSVDDQVVYTTRAEVLKYLGQFDASLQAYRDAKLRYPDSSYAWNGEADVLKEAGRHQEALDAYLIVRRRFHEDPVPHNGLVATLRRMGRLKDATREAWKNVKKFHGDSVSRTELANVFSAAGRYRDAASNYKKVLDNDTREIGALLAYVRTLNRLGERNRALSELMKRKRQDTGPVLANALVSQHRIMGDYPKALELARQLVQQCPGYSPAKFNLATVLLLAGDPVGAVSQLPHTDLRSEIDWRAYRTYLVCMLSGNPADAVKRIEEAEKECVWPSEKSRLSTVLAVAYARAEDTVKAVKILEKASILPDDHHKQTRLVLLGALNSQLGRKDVAETIIRRIVVTQDPTLLNYGTAILTRNMERTSFIPLLLAA